MKYNFDEPVDRSRNFSAKYDECARKFGREGLIPMWIADMDLKTTQPIMDAMEESYFAYPLDAIRIWWIQRRCWDC